MSVHTRTRRIRSEVKKATKPQSKAKPKKKSIPWREAFKDRIEKFTEPGLMLKGYRYKADMTQQEVAEELGISQHRVSELENGKRAVSKQMAHKFGALFKTNYRRFL
jgi:DNA-binding XRE family transcriptional regulator